MPALTLLSAPLPRHDIDAIGAGVTVGFPRQVYGLCGGAGVETRVAYEGEPLEDDDPAFAPLLAELQRLTAMPPPTPVRVEDAHVQPSPGRALDLGSGAFRYDTLYCETVNQLSDANLKEDIESLQGGRALVDRLRPVSFRYRGKRRTHLGFVAQEVRDALGEDAASYALWCETPVADPVRSGVPAGVTTVQSLRPDQLIAVLTRCCQEQDDLICDLQSKLADAEDKIEALLEQSGRHTSDISYCYETIAAIQKAIRERPPPS